MVLERINFQAHAHQYDYAPQYDYAQASTSGYEVPVGQPHPVRYEENGEIKELSGTTLGSAKTEVVKKGFKYFWGKFKKFVVKVFRSDEQAQKQVIDIADKTHKTIELINQLTPDNNNQQQYLYVA